MSVLGSNGVMGIVRYRTATDLDAVVNELTSAGIHLVEITLDTPGALPAIGRARSSGRPVGAGTVRTADDARAAVDAGAAFVVSPGLVPDAIAVAADAGVEAIPGVLTPTELLNAIDLGAAAVKVFPAGPAGGPAYVRALRGPFSDIDLVATGGIDPAEVREYLGAGAACVGLGGGLVGADAPSTSVELAAIGRRSREVLEAIDG
jgi:2-dehydro-3-deoxyphosphogluconate aldolase/(4S)-4-hydroxy-2-oxoglutarate aldolase